MILVGKEFKKVCEELGVDKFEIVDSLNETFNSQLSILNSKLILLKGSNGIGLYKLIPYL